MFLEKEKNEDYSFIKSAERGIREAEGRMESKTPEEASVLQDSKFRAIGLFWLIYYATKKWFKFENLGNVP